MSIYTATLKNLKDSAERVQIILTIRGLLLIVFLALMLSGPVLHESDIVAAVICWGGLALILTTALVVTVTGLRLKSILKLSLGTPRPHEGQRICSDELVRIFIHGTPVVIYPLCCLTIKLNFVSETLKTCIHQVTGSWLDDPIHEDILFPHRGEWQIDKIEVSFGDQLGLSRLSWICDDPSELGVVTVHAPPGFNRALPILSSSASSGDMADDVQEPMGDPYDLKQYHPSDGAKKILWKLYAKSGELVSRHVERTMTPEGQVVIFCVANQLEDRVVSRTLAYVQSVRELGLEVFVGCLGQGHEELARNLEEADELLTAAVWSSINSDPLIDARNVIGKAQNHLSGRRIERVLVFLARARTHDTQEARETAKALESLRESGIEPVVFMVSRGRISEETDASKTLGSKALNLLYQRVPDPNLDELEPAPDFIASCSANLINVITVD